MQPDDQRFDQTADGPTGATADSLPIPILLHIPWFPPDTTAPAPAADAAPQVDAPFSETIEVALGPVPAARPASPFPERPRRRRLIPALAVGLFALAAAAVIHGLWFPAPHTAAEREPIRLPPPDPAPALVSAAAEVRPVTLGPDIIPIDLGEEP